MSSFLVVIPYREPVHARVNGRRHRKPHLTRYEIEAHDAAEAIGEALRRFEQDAMDSSVGWTREVEHEGIRARRAESGQPGSVDST